MTSSLARPVSFDARYGDGIDRALVLGGGGVWFVAWQVTYLDALRRLGVDWGTAGRVVGTSAGSIVATATSGGRLARLAGEVGVLAKVPAVAGALAPAADLHPSQLRALELFRDAGTAEPEVVARIGHAALAARTPSERTMARNLRLLLGTTAWPSDALQVTATDAYTGERLVVRREHGVRTTVACAASSAVPGLFPPQPLGDRRAMDGGVSGSGTHADLVAGAARAVVVSLSDGSTVAAPTMTIDPQGFGREMTALRATGTEVLTVVPPPVTPEALMDPLQVPAAMASATERAHADADRVGEFWTR